MSEPFELRASVAKFDESLGLVMGWAIVSAENDVPYFDIQGDHIPEDAMLEAATDFAKNSRVAFEGHEREGAGTVVFAWPMTRDIANAFGVQVEKTGLMIAMQPDASMLAKFKSGELTGFSIGGQRILDEDVADAAE